MSGRDDRKVSAVCARIVHGYWLSAAAHRINAHDWHGEADLNPVSASMIKQFEANMVQAQVELIKAHLPSMGKVCRLRALRTLDGLHGRLIGLPDPVCRLGRKAKAA